MIWTRLDPFDLLAVAGLTWLAVAYARKRAPRNGRTHAVILVAGVVGLLALSLKRVDGLSDGEEDLVPLLWAAMAALTLVYLLVTGVYSLVRRRWGALRCAGTACALWAAVAIVGPLPAAFVRQTFALRSAWPLPCPAQDLYFSKWTASGLIGVLEPQGDAADERVVVFRRAEGGESHAPVGGPIFFADGNWEQTLLVPDWQQALVSHSLQWLAR